MEGHVGRQAGKGIGDVNSSAVVSKRRKSQVGRMTLLVVRHKVGGLINVKWRKAQVVEYEPHTAKW